MDRARRSRTLLVALDVQGAGRGPGFLVEFAEHFPRSPDAERLRVPLQLAGPSLTSHTRATFIREAIPRAIERAKEVFRAVPGATLGIGVAPALYSWGAELWSFSIAYVVDSEGPLFGTTSKSPEDVPEEMLAAFSADANVIAEKLIPSDVGDTLERRHRLELAIALCPFAVPDLVMRVPIGGNGST